jgi:hypothetical protein
MCRGTLRFAVALLVASSPLAGEICAVDDVPAATLLVPYFEIELGDPAGLTTLVTVANVTAPAALTQVTLWSDWGIPTAFFHLYLTGYDVQSLNLRDVFNGLLPRTADAGVDPQDWISNRGPLSEDADFPGLVGPCHMPYPAYPQPGLDALTLSHIRQAHTGRQVPGTGLCQGQDYGDNVARGYLTVDVVTGCSHFTPADAQYFAGIADRRNVLRGRVIYVDPGDNFAEGESAVHLEACPPAGGGSRCPFQPGQPTFYGGLLGASAADQREPLPTTFAVDSILGGAFDAGTDLLVWRDVKQRRQSAACGSLAGGLPLEESDAVAFDEQENLQDLCYPGDVVLPVGGPTACFPLAAQRVAVEGGNLVADDLAPPFDFGWLFLNLNHRLAAADPFPGVGQAWILAVTSAEGRFSIGHRAVALDSGCAAAPDGRVLVP